MSEQRRVGVRATNHNHARIHDYKSLNKSKKKVNRYFTGLVLNERDDTNTWTHGYLHLPRKLVSRFVDREIEGVTIAIDNRKLFLLLMR